MVHLFPSCLLLPGAVLALADPAGPPAEGDAFTAGLLGALLAVTAVALAQGLRLRRLHRERDGEASRDDVDTLRRLAGSLPAVLWSYSVQPDGTRTLLSGGDDLEALLGPETAAALHDDPGRSLEHVHPDDRERVAQARESAGTNAGPFDAEYRLRCADGGTRWVRSIATPRVRPDGVVIWSGMLLDIDATRRQQQEQRDRLLRIHAQQRVILRLAMDEAADQGDLPAAARTVTEVVAETVDVERVGVWLLDEDDRCLRSVDVLVASTGEHVSGIELRADEYPRYFAALRTGRLVDAHDALADPRTNEFTEVYLLPHGVTSMLDAAFFVSGRLAGVVCLEHVGPQRTWRADEIRFSGEVATQVAQALVNSHRRRAQDEHRRLEERMRHSERLESLGVLAGGIAHDFNNLLVSILGNAGLALLDVDETSPLRRLLEQVEIASRRAADLCNQLLAYSGKGRFVVEPLDLNALVAEMVDLLHASVGRNTELTYELAPDLPRLEGDATQIRQVLLNLVHNAAEALDETGGTISVRTELLQADRLDLACTFFDEELEPGPYLVLSVADTGRGMEPDTVRKVFDPFFSTKGTGRGLGLAAVLGIVRGHDGALQVQSAPGHGTAFRVLLPVANQGAPLAAPTPSDPAGNGETWQGSGTVLVADDQESVRSVTRAMLERHGFDVLPAADGVEAVELFRADPDGVVAVVLDLTMPRMGGDQALLQMRALRPELPSILTSGYSESQALALLDGQGSTVFLQKPYRPQELVARLREVLAG